MVIYYINNFLFCFLLSGGVISMFYVRDVLKVIGVISFVS